ncbi:Rz lysis protein [Flyfo siphovirus Tbat2_3]|nr:Rz lysis protein [Flyfo siphovirus Tbat2_3]
MNKSTGILVALLVFAILLLGWAADHYYSAYKKADDDLRLATQTISDMQVRQRDAAALDAKYTGELADAKATIETLRDDVATGKRRLRLNASCPKSEAAGTSSLGDASSPRLDDYAERDYFRLRDGINTVTKQVNYLQDYIRQQCLN